MGSRKLGDLYCVPEERLVHLHSASYPGPIAQIKDILKQKPFIIKKENFEVMPGTTLNTIILNASARQIYAAFTEQAALEYWLAPDGMNGKIHDFDLGEGGGYEMSLYYPGSETAGKTTANEDRFRSTFTVLEPYSRIVQVIQFQSDDPGFAGEMTMEALLDEIDNESTKLTIVFRNIPAGINPKDNEEGTEQSLQKLARYLGKEQ